MTKKKLITTFHKKPPTEFPACHSKKLEKGIPKPPEKNPKKLAVKKRGKIRPEKNPRKVAVLKKTIQKKKKGKKSKLTAKQELFCEFYISKDFFGSGIEAYAEAYDIDVTKRGQYGVARTSAHRLLANVDILTRIDELLEHSVLNHEFVDREMAFVIQQKSDLNAKMRAVAEYNKIKKRVSEGTTINIFDLASLNAASEK